MSKLTKLLAQAALVAVAGTWGTSLAHADITYSLQLDGASSATYTTNMASTGGEVVLDLVANISTPGLNSGLYYSMGNFVATYTGTDAGKVSNVTLGAAFLPAADHLNLSQTGTELVVSPTISNWGDTTSSGAGNSFVAFTNVFAADNATVAAQAPDGFGNILLGKLTYTVSQITPGQTISVAYVPRNPAGGAATVWVEDDGTTTTYKSNVVVSDSQGNSTVAGTAIYTPFVVTASSGSTQWAGVDGGNWSEATSWTSGMPSPTGTALFQDHVPALLTSGVNLAADHTIATVDFNSTNSALISSNANKALTVTSAITLNNGTSHTISADLKLGGNVAVSLGTNLNPAATLNVFGSVDTNGHTLTIGAGTSVVSDAIGGGAGWINNATGTIVNNGNLTLKGTLLTHNLGTINSSGTLTIAAGATATADVLTGGGHLNVAGMLTVNETAAPRNNTGSVIELKSLSLTGTLDVTNHDMIIHFDPAVTSDSAAFYQVQAWIYNGLGSVTPDGTVGNAVLTSSTEGSNKWLTLFDNAAVQAGSFDGVTLSDYNQIIVKYTYQGDVNWDGVVDYQDYNYLDGQVGLPVDPLFGVLSGDANLDGVVDYQDYNFVDGSAGSGSGGIFGNPLVTGGPVAVPEPASLSLLGLSAALLLTRRSQKRK